MTVPPPEFIYRQEGEPKVMLHDGVLVLPVPILSSHDDLDNRHWQSTRMLEGEVSFWTGPCTVRSFVQESEHRAPLFENLGTVPPTARQNLSSGSVDVLDKRGGSPSTRGHVHVPVV
jgi:hypothetical protein